MKHYLTLNQRKKANPHHVKLYLIAFLFLAHGAGLWVLDYFNF